ncbi:MAG: lytic transglycosylase domain-containing protein [Myxococcaceae bacterium]
MKRAWHIAQSALFVCVMAAAIGVGAVVLMPLSQPPDASNLEALGVQEVLPEGYALIDQVLAKKALGLGMVARKQVAIAIADESAKAGFDPLMILALIDVESDYQDDAVSPVGAKGLMQIRPTTLYFLAQKEGLKLSYEEVERDPALRVRLGVRYLKSLSEQCGGNLTLALMAYNMGPNKLREQLKSKNLEQYKGYPLAIQREYLTLRTGLGLGGDWTLASRAK